MITVGGDDRLLADDVLEVLFDRLLDLLVVASLIDRSLPMEGPVVLTQRDRECHGSASMYQARASCFRFPVRPYRQQEASDSAAFRRTSAARWHRPSSSPVR